MLIHETIIIIEKVKKKENNNLDEIIIDDDIDQPFFRFMQERKAHIV